MPLDLNKWFQGAFPGFSVQYYRGQTPQSVLDIFLQARSLYEQGKVCLVQRRYGPGDYSYLAIKRRVIQPVPKTDALSSTSRRNHIDVAT